MPLPVLLILGGLVLLVGGAELLVRGSSRLALRLGVPSLVVGLTVVAYGTSTPELVVSAKAALSGQADLALGNVVGSNIFNVLLILGASALLAPLRVTRPIIWREVPVMIGTSLLTWGLALDGRISRGDGTLLVALLIAYTIYQIQAGLKEGGKKTAEERTKVSILGSLVSIAVGLAVLVWGARWLLEGSVSLARGLGVSELIIGLTIVAAGTSLPEVATSLLATWRGEREIAIGNVVGSNIYNVLGVLGLAAVIGPEGVAVSSPALNFDIPVMVAVSVACLPIFLTGHLIARWEGVLFLFYYGAYTLFLLLNTTHHDALPAFSATMLWGALPLTAMTLLVGIVRHRRTTRPPASS
ncbi:MAG: calcium/sodium antiporter [Elusimicrobia bacterium]|nr:calcium/sodium antiporter [Elusimicrobiota bacterium]MBK9429741.1 calcium/sodium antiporter [Elusimicrobiota bacterium]MBK9921736.1 calcium/sodium antiporter [Elusimicrobiota bacterium]MBL0360876.1 calcium/sodium antiporter [Elusimicrobiota bacterium]